jgi:hypothetical protein
MVLSPYLYPWQLPEAMRLNLLCHPCGRAHLPLNHLFDQRRNLFACKNAKQTH